MSYIIDEGRPGRWFVTLSGEMRMVLGTPEWGWNLEELRQLVRRLRASGHWREFRGPNPRGPHWVQTPQQREASRRRMDCWMSAD